MKLKIGEKELSVKFAYKPTLKERIVSKVLKLSEYETMEDIEDLLMFLPEFLLVGLQTNHKEYRYNYDTGEGKDEQIGKICELIDEYSEENNPVALFELLETALEEDSFLKSMFDKKKSKEKAEKQESKEKN